MKNRSKITIAIAVSFAGIVLFGVSGSFIDPLIHDIARLNSIQNYEAVEATCNAAGAEPDGTCFINAFDECRSASIKQMLFSFEGDPIFYYAHVIQSEPCTIRFTIDTSQDVWGGQNKGLHHKICTDATVDAHHIYLLCPDDNDGVKTIFPLSYIKLN